MTGVLCAGSNSGDTTDPECGLFRSTSEAPIEHVLNNLNRHAMVTLKIVGERLSNFQFLENLYKFVDRAIGASDPIYLYVLDFRLHVFHPFPK